MQAYMNSSPRKVNNAIRSIIRGEKKLNNPELVLELLNNVQYKLDTMYASKPPAITFQ